MSNDLVPSHSWRLRKPRGRKGGGSGGTTWQKLSVLPGPHGAGGTHTHSQQGTVSGLSVVKVNPL